MTTKASGSYNEEKEDQVVASHCTVNSDTSIDPVEETKLLRKLDFWVCGTMGVLYLLCFLDRANIGNANVAGFSTDLKLKGNQYGAAVSVVYATYVSFEPIWANLLKVIGPRQLMSATTLVWGAITLGTAFVTNFNQLIACRLLLGLVEAGLFPSVNMYFAMTYRREEHGRRLSYLFACAAASGAFGGLLAFGLTRIVTPSLKRWQWLYLVEGLISMLYAPIAFLIIPNTLTKAKFLNKRERELCAIRYEINKHHYDPSENFSWLEVRKAAFSWMTWSHSVMQFCTDTSLYAITTFMPKIIAGLDLTTNTVYSQLLTVPVYAVAAISFLIGARLSDKSLNRSIPIIIYSIISAIGYIIVAAASNPKVQYFGVFVIAFSLYGPVSLNVTWVTGNTAKHFRRATAVGLMQLVGNSSGACVGFIFSADTAPGYHRGLWVTCGLSITMAVIAAAHAFVLSRINAYRRKLVDDGAADQPELGNDNPHFVYVL